jgi:hypothetical protein
MGWKKLTATELVGTADGQQVGVFTPTERRVLSSAANRDAADTLQYWVTTAVGEFVGALSAANYPVNTDGSVPDQLRRYVIDSAVWNWLLRFPALRAFRTREREDASRNAHAVYKSICARTYGAVESPTGTDFGTGNWNSEVKLVMRTHPVPTPAQQFSFAQPTLGAVPANQWNSINYPGPPTVNPPQIGAVVVDSQGRQWQFVNGAWQ